MESRQHLLNLPTVELVNMVIDLEEELAKQKELTELYKERYLAENAKLIKIVREG
jgi:hypothetical protein